MELIVTLLAAFPIGYLIRKRLAAFVAYIGVHSFVFTFQTATLIIAWAGGDTAAFGPFPTASTANVWGYAEVNLAIYLVGLALVFLGHRVATRRASRSDARKLDPVT
ncbi:hypothetical protein [Lapillicoccus sp.]|uniref:hypothetical protein n=1 Tax=Lapillicoccus sp. TaxID=1909287 RepID=UPI0032660BBF